jgi:1-deoxy-D-xylulose-5-phosphate reductoisomerase
VRIALLGSTGSIGRQTLDVVRRHPTALRVVALATHRNIALLAAQAAEFDVRVLAIGDEELKASPLLAQLPDGAEIGFGAAAVEALCARSDVDCVLNALVGAAGLRASYTTLMSGHRLALANKESLVVGGDLIMPLAREQSVRERSGQGQSVRRQNTAPATLLPVDSEHSAIFQCLVGESAGELDRIWLTASGGPFRGWSRAQVEKVTAADALAHPTWHMGPKISIDSATMMNKGLEVIEAHHLFATSYDDIRVVVHPQSTVHSMVEYRDGSIKAHLGVTDMRIPIQYALSYPQRWDSPSPLEPLDFAKLGQLTFEEPNVETFGALRLALEAGRTGGTAPAVLNAANEVAVAAFLEGACGFFDIERIVETTLERHTSTPVTSLSQLEETDTQARKTARTLLPS